VKVPFRGSVRYRVPPEASFLVLAVFIWLAMAAAPTVGAAKGESGPTTDTPLQSRAKRVLESYGQAKTKEDMAASRDALLSMADTLEAAGEDVLASHCLERAGIVCYRFAEYERGVRIGDRGLAVARRSGDRKRIAALLNFKAIMESARGNDALAVKLQTELIALRREDGDTRGEGVSWHNLAYSYFALFRTPEAIDALQNALRLHREAGNAWGAAVSMSSLSNSLFEVGRYDAALAMADSAVAAAVALNEPAVLGPALGGRAKQRHYAHRLDEALVDFERAHEILNRAGMARIAAGADINHAHVLVSLGRCEDALGLLDEIDPVLAASGSVSERIWARAVRGRALAACDRPEEARAVLVATIERLEAFRDTLATELSRAEAFRLAGGAYCDLAALDAAEGRPRHAWRVIETGPALLLRNELAGAGAGELAGGGTAEPAGGGTGEAAGAGAGDRTAAVGAETLSRLQSRLGEIDALALQYGQGSVDRFVACLITPDSVGARVVEIPRGLRGDVASALRLMASGASDAQCAPVLERVASTVLSPLVGVDTVARRLVVFPGAFTGLPFEALPMGSDSVSGGKPLGERFAVTYAPSATAFLYLEDRVAPAGRMVVFADPSGDTAPARDAEVPAAGVAVDMEAGSVMRSEGLSRVPLPEARSEAKHIATRGAEILVGARARKWAYYVFGTGAAVLHFATHAQVDRTHPDHSAIVLAPGDGGPEALTAVEIRAAPLAADLVTLSGCRTAGGYLVAGEGALGLTRSFLVAGARTVVSSWWDVEDGAARRFMELFYGALRDGTARDFALQATRMQMAREGYPHRDRMAFSIAGATAEPVLALSSTSSPSRVVAYGAVAAILLVAAAASIHRRRRRAA
jgi:tetratricopeptide (TPR) repeat protein